MVLIIMDSCSRSITEQALGLIISQGWYISGHVVRECLCLRGCLGSVTERHWPRRPGERPCRHLANFMQVRNSSDHSPIEKKLFMLKLARLRETWKMTASVFLPDAKTKTSWPLETCSVKGCWFAMIVFCICLILHLLFTHWVSL